MPGYPIGVLSVRKYNRERDPEARRQHPSPLVDLGRMLPAIPIVRNEDMGRIIEHDTPTSVRTHCDAPGLLAGATNPRMASWSTSPEYCGIELLWQCAWRFPAYGNSGHSLPAISPIDDALRATELQKIKTRPSSPPDTQNATPNYAP